MQDYTVIDLGTLGGKSSSAFAINANGQITGSAATAAGHQHAFLYQNGIMEDLGTLGGKSSAGLAINIKGQITGYADTADEIEHAFMYDGSLTDLGTLNGGKSRKGNQRCRPDHWLVGYPRLYLLRRRYDSDSQPSRAVR